MIEPSAADRRMMSNSPSFRLTLMTAMISFDGDGAADSAATKFPCRGSGDMSRL